MHVVAPSRTPVQAGARSARKSKHGIDIERCIMVPDIAYEYARQRFREMLLDGTDYRLRRSGAGRFLKRYEPSSEQDLSNRSCSNAARNPVSLVLQAPRI